MKDLIYKYNKQRKTLFFSSLFIYAMFLVGFCGEIKSSVICVQLDPLQRAFTEDTHFVENAVTAAVARGETASFQFVIRSEHPIQNLTVEAGNLVNGRRMIVATEKAFVGYVRGGVHHPPGNECFFPKSDLYPDVLLEKELMDVEAKSNQPVWVGYYIPRDAESGKYTTNIVLSGISNGKNFKITKKVNAEVFPVTLPEQTMYVTNWYTFDATKALILNGKQPDFTNWFIPDTVNQFMANLDRSQPVEMFSDRYWELFADQARLMGCHGHNTYLVGTQYVDFWTILCDIKIHGRQFTWDFANFDKMVDILIREGGLKRIEGGPFACNLPQANGHWSDQTPMGIRVPAMGTLAFEHPYAQNYLTQFLPALYNHLKSKGWLDIYIQHVADEPTPVSLESHTLISKKIKELMPGVKTVDAVFGNATEVDIECVLLDHLHHTYDVFKERQAAGKELWMYVACGPGHGYANRFLQMPLLRPRYLSWVMYRYGITGFLHYAFNWWNIDEGWQVLPWNIPRTYLPGGDPWIVYPGEGKQLASVRLKAFRDGIADYELLKLLEQKNPEKAKELVGRLIFDFDSYNHDINDFRQTRMELLKALSE